MLYDFVVLNIKLTQREFGFSIAFACASFIVTSMASSGAPGVTVTAVLVLFIAGLVGMLIFFLIGMAKLCHGSLLGDCGYLYMTLPVSMSKSVWGKVLSGSFWVFLIEVLAAIGLLIYINPQIFSTDSFDSVSVATQEIFLKEAIWEGMPAGQVGFLCLFVMGIAIAAGMILCAAILLSSVVLHSIRVSRAKIPAGILIYAGILGCVFGAFLLQGFFVQAASIEHLLLVEIVGFAADVGLLVLLLYLSKLLLEKRLEI